MIKIWTDGSCNNNKKHSSHALGGWAYTAKDEDGITIAEDLGYEEGATSSTMEMKAVLEALKFAVGRKERGIVEIHSDSAYVVNCFLEKWYIRWQEIEWQDIKNSELWQDIIELTKLIKVRFIKVKGHAGIEENERVDYLAGIARKHLICLLEK